MINGFKHSSQSLAIFPARKVERIADQVHDASLDLHLQINRPDRFRETSLSKMTNSEIESARKLKITNFTFWRDGQY